MPDERVGLRDGFVDTVKDAELAWSEEYIAYVNRELAKVKPCKENPEGWMTLEELNAKMDAKFGAL